MNLDIFAYIFGQNKLQTLAADPWNFNYISINSFILLYKSMVRSLLDYCVSVWVPYNKSSASAEVADRNVTWYVL